MSEATPVAVPAAPARTALGRLRAVVANPWGRSRLLMPITWAYMIWAIIPVAIAVLFSFNAGRSRSTWQGFSLQWYLSHPDLSVASDPTLRAALGQSLKLAIFTMLITVPIGVALALGLARWRGRGSGSANFLMLFPLVTPEIVLATALFLIFTTLFRSFVQLGTTAQLLGHVTFSISYVVIVVRGRLLTIGRDLEEAAMDLGAPPMDALRRVLIPLLFPAIFASFMIVFAISIDDFVTSQFLSSDEATITVPMMIYATARTAPTPALNALASLVLVATLLAVGTAGLVQRAVSTREGRRRPGAPDLTGFRV